MTANTNITMSTNEILSKYADDLGYLRGRIASLQEEARDIEKLLKGYGIEELDGTHYRVTISYGVTTRRVDWKTVAAKLEPSHQLVAAHTRLTQADRVRVTALRKAP